MSETEFETCECVCGQRIEYPVHARGAEINCPGCQRKLICKPPLTLSKKFQSPASKLCVVAALIGILSPILTLYGNHRSQIDSQRASQIYSLAQSFSANADACDKLVKLIRSNMIKMADHGLAVQQIWFNGSLRIFETNQMASEIVAHEAQSEDSRRSAEDYSNQGDALIKSAKFFSHVHLAGIILGWLCPALFLLAWISWPSH